LEEILEDNVGHSIAILCLRMDGALASVSKSWGEKGPRMGRTKRWCPFYIPLWQTSTSHCRGGRFCVCLRFNWCSGRDV